MMPNAEDNQPAKQLRWFKTLIFYRRLISTSGDIKIDEQLPMSSVLSACNNIISLFSITVLQIFNPSWSFKINCLVLTKKSKIFSKMHFHAALFGWKPFLQLPMIFGSAHYWFINMNLLNLTLQNANKSTSDWLKKWRFIVA